MTDSMADSTEIDDDQVTDSRPEIPTDTTTDPDQHAGYPRYAYPFAYPYTHANYG